MVIGVNLINLEAKRTVEIIRLRRRVKNLSLLFLLFFIFLSLVTFGGLIFVNSLSKKNQNKITLLKEQIRSMEKMESYLVIISDRTKNINTFLKNKHSYSQLLEDLRTLLVPGFKLEDLQIGSQGKLTMTGRCQDLASITALNEQVDKINQKKIYAQIAYPSLSKSPKGDWEVSLELNEK